jgi:hypothetical protein
LRRLWNVRSMIAIEGKEDLAQPPGPKFRRARRSARRIDPK